MPLQQNPRRGPPPQKGSGQQRESPAPWRDFVIWGPILFLLMAWIIFTLSATVHPKVDIPYTVFLAQVRADNISKVYIVGDAIAGSFVKPLRWPEPSRATSSSPLPNADNSRAKQFKPNGPQALPTMAYTEFQITFPSAVGDPTLMSALEAHKVVVDVSHPSSPWLFEFLSTWLPMLLLVGFFWWMGTKASQNQAGLFGLGRSKARRYSEDQPKVTFNDVAGADEAKSDLQEEVDFLRHPLKYHNVGARIPRGVLLVAPPGTGKTLLARAVAGEAGVPFFSLSASEFVEMFVGVGKPCARPVQSDEGCRACYRFH